MDFFGENTGLYFYSAVFQGNMALLALVGVFAVFRLQQYQSALDRFDTIVASFVRDVFLTRNQVPFPFSYVDVSRLWDDVQAMAIRQKEQGQSDSIYNMNAIIDTAGDLNRSVKFLEMRPLRVQLAAKYAHIVSAFKSSVYATLVVIFLSLVLLILASPIHENCRYAEPLLFVLTIAANLLSLALTVSFAFRCFRDQTAVRNVPERQSVRGGESPDSPR